MASLAQRLQKLEAITPDGPSQLDFLLWRVYRSEHPELDLPIEPQPPYCTKTFEELLLEMRERDGKH